MTEDPPPPGVQIGLATALTLWTIEFAVVAAVNADAGGLGALPGMIPSLARWGLGYLLLGALAGAVFGRRWALQGLPWLLVWVLGDRGIAPPALYLVLIAVAWGLGPLWGRWRRAPAVLAVAGLLLGLGSVRWPRSLPEATGDGPDIVLIVVDTLRRDHVGAYGYARDTTPGFDRFASTARLYTHARANASWTLPSHASLFTGLLPSEHGAVANHPLLRDQPTLASRLAERGYRTIGFASNAWVGKGTRLDQGFQHFEYTGADGIASQLLLPLAVVRARDLGGAATTEGALAALAGEGPTFLFLNYLEAHEPMGTVPREDLDRFSDTPLDPTLGRVWVRDMARFWCGCDGPAGDLACVDGHPSAPESRVVGIRDRYDAGVYYVDREIQKVLAAVDDDAIVVVTSDHGELIGEYDGRMGHMVTLEPELIDIPLAIRAPALPLGLDDAPITLADLPELLLALADDTPPPARLGFAVSESHPHTDAVTGRWERFFDCECSLARQHRRVVWDGTTQWSLGDRSDGEPARLLALPFADGEAEAPDIPALRALGYVQ